MPESPSVNATKIAILGTILGPDGAFFMTCQEILSALGLPPFQPARGFMEIISTTPNLNVVAEYSSESFNPFGVSTGIALDVETIPSSLFVP